MGKHKHPKKGKTNLPPHSKNEKHPPYFIKPLHTKGGKNLFKSGINGCLIIKHKNLYFKFLKHDFSFACFGGRVFLWIIERKRSCGFRRIFTVAFLLFLAHVWGSNPVGQSLTFT